MAKTAYERAGVNIAAGERAVEGMKASVRATFNEHVLSDLGSFGGLFDLAAVSDMERPVLVASTDGVGTKVEVARRMNRWDTVGQCLVNHCVNDILVQGARPLFFLDFIGCNRLEEKTVTQIVEGMARACAAVGCALLGGETAEMGEVYGPGGIEVAGTIVGAVSRSQVLDGSAIEAGDLVFGLASSGLHTNGYTLARKVLGQRDWATDMTLGQPLGEALLEVHRCYLEPVKQLEPLCVKGLAHVTGGGIPGNFRRVLPSGLGADLELPELPPLFKLLAEEGGLSFEDMLPAFNLGVGMLVVLPAGKLEEARALVPELQLLGKVDDSGEIQVRCRSGLG